MKLGKNLNISNEEYHGDREYVSSSGLKLMLKDPKKYYDQYVLGEKGKTSDAMDFGTYLHALILEPDTIEENFAIFNGSRNSNAYKEFALSNKGKILLTEAQRLAADTFLNNYKESTLVIGKHGYEEAVPIPTFFEDGEAEETMCCEIDGIKVKARFDYRREFDEFGSIQDVKTTSYAVNGVEDVVKICRSWDYDISAALYVDVAEHVTGKKHDFYFLFISKKDGGISLFRASEEFLNEGREKYKTAISRLKQARETGIYYDNKIPEIPSLSTST
jgi:hypothetical protein